MPVSFLEIIILFSKQAKLHGEFSATIITSVHKMPTPSSMRDSKPISYLNIIYKCICKNGNGGMEVLSALSFKNLTIQSIFSPM